ncbi:MAG: SH3 domain-containing protein, partial [Aggregatilineales bacterium]
MRKLVCLIFLFIAACTPETLPENLDFMRAVTATPDGTQVLAPTISAVINSPGSLTATPGTIITPVPERDEPRVSENAGQIRVYRYPSTRSEVVVLVNALAPITPLGRNPESNWVKIGLSGGYSGWTQTVLLAGIPDVSELEVIVTDIIEITSTPAPHAFVEADADGLRLRASPGTGDILTELAGDTPLFIIGRELNNTWLEVVTLQGDTGWVSAEFLSINIVLADVPVTGEITIAITATPAGLTTTFNGSISNITDRAREIVKAGQRAGNRRNIFSKIGDSLTVATWVMYPIGWGTYDLGDYAALQPAIEYFSAENAREGNSFANISLAADNGWTTRHLLDPETSISDICQEGEVPLVCEYRVLRPAVALILIGTNDVAALSEDEYRENLQRIVDISIEQNVLPVLSTIPERPGFDDKIAAFNRIIREIVSRESLPLWDYNGAMRTLPNAGLSDDNVHPSAPSGDWAEAAIFSPQNLQSGYTLRNLSTLQVLDAIWRQVLSGL